MGAFNRHKGALVGIADGEYNYRLSPEFTVRLPIVTLSSRDNKLNGVFIAPCVKSK
jgi:hypothetical protein